MFGPTYVNSDYDCERGIENSKIYALVCALDYKGTSCELTCTYDGNNMQKLLKDIPNVADTKVLYDNQATKKNAIQAIKQIATRCGPDDVFVFYYSGHGSHVQGGDSDDDALCFVGPNGELEAQYFMTDDEFAECLTSSMPQETRILILCDCCHSGTVGNFESPSWQGREGISITACMDSETAGDIGTGGIFTHCMLLAIEKLNATNKQEKSTGLIFNASLHENETIFHGKQHITLLSTPSIQASQMAWPLVPKRGYRAPMSQAVGSVSDPVDHDEDHVVPGGGVPHTDVIAQLLNNPDMLKKLGINPALLPFMQAGSGQFIGHLTKHEEFHSEDYLKMIEQAGCLKDLQGCSIM